MALLKSGNIICWGSNVKGECDVPANLGSVQTLKAATYASFAVLQGGGLRAWGAVKTDELPSIVRDTTVQIAAGEFHALAIVEDGGQRRVVAIGYGSPDANLYGQLQVPSEISSGVYKVNLAATEASGGIPVGAIVGTVVGVLIVAGLVGGLVFWKRKKQIKDQQQSMAFDSMQEKSSAFVEGDTKIEVLGNSVNSVPPRTASAPAPERQASLTPITNTTTPFVEPLMDTQKVSPPQIQAALPNAMTEQQPLPLTPEQILQREPVQVSKNLEPTLSTFTPTQPDPEAEARIRRFLVPPPPPQRGPTPMTPEGTTIELPPDA